MVRIIDATSQEHIQIVSQMMREYSEWLGFDLSYQGFEEELAGLPGKYAPPGGALVLAYIDDEPVGMVAMRKIGPDVCEMKRLYLRPEGRGSGLGRRLVEEIMTRGRAAGFSKMRLDTVAGKMDKAISLYREFGFEEIAAYYPSPVEHTIFLEADLRQLLT